MSAVGTLLSAIVDAMTPDASLTRMRLRTTLDLGLTAAITLLAIGLTIGYQVFGRWARRQSSDG